MLHEISRFDCAEYFQNFAAGRYDADAYLWFILPAEEIRVDNELDALVIGLLGADGIQFYYRAGYSGIWAYYPICGEWVAVSPTLKDFEERWNNGSIGL